MPRRPASIRTWNRGRRKKYRDRLGRIHFFRSRWELGFAIFMDFAGIDFVYEKFRFRHSCGVYVPDFYLPEYDKFIEIKRYISSDHQASDFDRVGEVMNLHKVKIIVLEGKQLSEIGSLKLGYSRVTRHRRQVEWSKVNRVLSVPALRPDLLLSRL